MCTLSWNQPTSGKRTHTVLIVEDEPKNIKVVRDLLQANGFVTLEARNGQEGIDLARACRPDLILMDIQVPVLDGLEATRILKADPETCHIPVLALTAYAMKGDEERVRAAGCDGYITKPLRLTSFLEQIGAFLSPVEDEEYGL